VTGLLFIDWYVYVLGLKVEFEVSNRLTAAVQDQHNFTIFSCKSSFLTPP